MDDVSAIIEGFGGTGALAALCEVAPSAVSQWKSKNRIPPARRQFLLLKRPDLFERPAQPGNDESRAAA
jgi:hypothetical protein